MANKLAEATLVLKVDSREYDLAIRQMPKDADKAAQSVKGIGQAVNLAVFKEFANVAFSAFKTVIGGIVELGERGAAVDDVANSFSILTAKTGETADAMIGKLRQGVVGTLSDYDLMTLANKTLGSGLAKTADDMGVLAAGARTLAKATGGTTKEAFDTLTTAMASGRTASLKQLGLFVDSKVATENYAAALGKSVSQLTDADRAQALAAASLAALRQRMKEVTPDAADFGELIEQAKVRLENFKDQVAVGIAKSPVFAAGMATMGKALDEAFGTNQKAQVSGLVGMVENLAIALTYIAQGAQLVGKIGLTVFSGLEVIVQGVITATVGWFTVIATVVDRLAQLRASLPLASDEAKNLAASTGAVREEMKNLTAGFAANTAEAFKGVIGQGALHEKLDAMGGAIVRVRDAMQEAQGKTSATTKAVVALGDAAPPAAAKNQKMADKISEAFRALNDEMVAGTAVGLEKRLVEIEMARSKELDGLTKFKFESIAQHDEMLRLINEKYRQRVAAAMLAGDEIKAKERDVQNDIALQLTTGTANKLLQIQIARDKEIESLAFLKANHEEQYAADVAAVTEKYRLQSEAAQGYYATIELAAAAAGFKTREELQAEADNAKRLYAEMLASGQYTQTQLEAAHQRATDAQMALDGKRTLGAMEQFDLLASSASTMLRSIFGKSKAAAIAAAIIDTAAAVAKTLASYPWPFSLVPAAAAAAAGYAQVKAIRSTNADGFAQGTPGLDFMDFGAQSFQPLHNQEAVIPRGGGHLLAGEIANSMPGSDEQTSLLREIAGLLRAAPSENRKAFRNAILLDTA